MIEKSRIGAANPRKGARNQPVLFITKPQLAQALGVEPSTIDDWVRDGKFPPPHSRIGERTALWRRDHFDHFVEHRRWPRAAYYDSGGCDDSL